MKTKERKSRVGFKIADGDLVVAWGIGQSGDSPLMDDGQRQSVFVDFANIRTPSELIDVFERLVRPPVYPDFTKRDVRSVGEPETILEEFDIRPTRTNIRRVKDLLDQHDVQTDWYFTIRVDECVAMIRDMRALLTVLMFAYGQCKVEALAINTQYDFAFLYGFSPNQFGYGNFLGGVREEDPHVLMFDQEYINEDIEKALKARGGKPTRKTLASMQRFAERYINGFMWTARPVIQDKKFRHTSKDNDLGSIYAFWAEKIAGGKTLACPECGKLLAKTRSNQVYCGKNCGVKANQAKHRS